MQYPQRRSAIAIAILAGLVVAVYWQAGSFRFTNYDDDLYVTKNPRVAAGLTLSGIRWAFTTIQVSNWHPIAWLSHMLDVSLFGLSAGKHHLVNVLIHLLNTLLLFHALRRATGRFGECFLVAGLFAVHPSHVESVAWISQRKDLLCAFFSLLAISGYVGYCERPGAGRYIKGVLLPFALALMSKPMAVTLPFLLLLLDFWPLGRTSAWRPASGAEIAPPGPVRLLTEKAPLLLLSALSAALTLMAQSKGGAVASLDFLPMAPRIANALFAPAAYLWKAVWPVGLSVIYPLPESSGLVLKGAAGAAFLAGATALAVRQRRQRPYLAVGWFWFLVMLVPVIGIVQVGMQSMADRYTYLSLVGAFVVAAWGMGEAASRSGIPRKGTEALSAALLVLLAYLAHGQAGYWRDSVSLFRHALEATSPDNKVAQVNLGGALSAEGRDEEALGHYREVLRISPGDAEAEYAMYQTLARLGREEEAVAHFGAALRRTEGNAESNNNIGLALAGTGRVEEALSYFREAVRIRPDFAEAHYNLGVALSRLGRKDEAVPHFREALRIRPVDAESHNKLGVARMGLGRLDDAVGHFRAALDKRPDYGDARFNLAVALERSGKREAAMRELEEILRLSPGDRDAEERLARIRESGGR